MTDLHSSAHSCENPGTRVIPSFCRNCLASCPILVTVENGRATKVVGDREAPAYEGYTCPKGRELPAQHNHPNRLLGCRKRTRSGELAAIDSSRLIDEVATRVEDIIARHGKRSVAVFYGTGNVTNPAGSAMARSWISALGSNLVFSAMSIDKPAANISISMHGHWHAGAQSFESSDTWMIVGANPVIAKSNGAPVNNPGQRLKEAVERGMKLIVVDPRRTETAKRAAVHLQPRPGNDAALLAGLIRIIIAEGLHDPQFIADNAEGFEELRQAVAPFTPEVVAARTDVPVAQLLEAARTFGRAKRGGVICSTGPSFSPHGNLSFYLGLCLNTLCGRWAREGEQAPYPNVLLPAFQPRAEPYAPYPVFGSGAMRVRGLRETAAGMPTAALADEILTSGEGQIKALICLGGNPMLSWPDQAHTEAALKSLELLVVMDTTMTPTAELADYVVASPLSLETAGSTSRVEALKYVGVARGFTIPWAQYTPKVVDTPAGSDIVEDAEFFFRLSQRMGLQLSWTNARGHRAHVEGPAETHRFDMSRVPSNEELIELTCAGSRIPLDEVRKHPHGRIFDEARVTVAPKDPACTARLQLADPMMIDELAALAGEAQASPSPARVGGSDGPHLLISRRINKVMNSVGHHIGSLATAHAEPPAYMHPAELERLGLATGEVVCVRSAHGHIRARVEADESLRRDTIAVVHGFGGLSAGHEADGTRNATSHSVTRLMDSASYDRISGLPVMSALEVWVEKIRVEVAA